MQSEMTKVQSTNVDSAFKKLWLKPLTVCSQVKVVTKSSNKRDAYKQIDGALGAVNSGCNA